MNTEVAMRVPDPENQARIRAEAEREGIKFVQTREELIAALRAAEGVLFALPKNCQSKRRTQVLAQVRAALRGTA